MRALGLSAISVVCLAMAIDRDRRSKSGLGMRVCAYLALLGASVLVWL